MQIITGMHRSGTSLTAQLCYHAGARMGNPGDFYPPDRWNPQGYYEDRVMRRINLELLHGPWWKFAYFRLPDTGTIVNRARRLDSRLRAAAQRYARHVVKDPRFCLTLPAWQGHGADIRSVVVCIREPHEVALSLRKRNAVPLALGYALWEEHYARLLPMLNALRVRYIHYNRLIQAESFTEEILPCLGFLGLSVSEEKARGILGKVADPDMNHFGPAKGPYPLKVRALWQKLLELHRAQPRA